MNVVVLVYASVCVIITLIKMIAEYFVGGNGGDDGLWWWS